MNQYLVISALGQDRPGIVERISKAILDQGGNIEESRMSILGGEFALMLLVVSGKEAIEQLQSHLPSLSQTMGLTITSKLTQPASVTTPLLHAHVEALDHPGIVHKVTEFFSQQQLNIQSLETDTYPAPHTGSPMFSLDIELQNNSTKSVDELKLQFTEYCEQLGLDGELDTTPIR